MKKIDKKIIGWREWIQFPDFKNAKVKAKVDSGARTSSLHAYNVKVITEKGVKKVHFELFPNQDNKEGKVIVKAPLVDYRNIKSSNGHQEKRPVIITPIKMFDEIWTVEITLTNRDIMGFRMLLGRQAIRNRFVIDVGRSFLSTKTKMKRSKK
jgi:hypothetical protein